jgi:hypothetical protein
LGLIGIAFAMYSNLTVKPAVAQVKFEFAEKIGEIKQILVTSKKAFIVLPEEDFNLNKTILCLQ